MDFNVAAIVLPVIHTKPTVMDFKNEPHAYSPKQDGDAQVNTFALALRDVFENSNNRENPFPLAELSISQNSNVVNLSGIIRERLNEKKPVTITGENKELTLIEHFSYLYKKWIDARQEWGRLQQEKMSQLQQKYQSSPGDWWSEYLLWYENNAELYIRKINAAYDEIIANFPLSEWGNIVTIPDISDVGTNLRKDDATDLITGDTKGTRIDNLFVQLGQHIYAWFAILPQTDDNDMKNAAFKLYEIYEEAKTNEKGKKYIIKDKLIPAGNNLASAATRFLKSKDNAGFRWLDSYIEHLVQTLAQLSIAVRENV